MSVEYVQRIGHGEIVALEEAAEKTIEKTG